MTWSELLFCLSKIPEDRIGEKAVFATKEDGDIRAWEIDCVSQNNYKDKNDPDITAEDLEMESIFDENAFGHNPITLTP